jgi:DNA helicase-2/ATP-dependent DNA helicase PcrA
MKHIEMVDELTDKMKELLAGFWKKVMKWQEESNRMKVSELAKKIVQDVGFKQYLLDGTEEGEMRFENVLELISVATKYDDLPPDVSLISFLEEVALVADTDQIQEDLSNVTLMTLHSVKGLEYPYVFIVGCEENIFPHSRSLLEEAEMEEERRLMYVGVTRAMKKLYLVAAKQRMLYGDYQSNQLSRFIYDIPEELVTKTGVEAPEDFSEFRERPRPVTEEAAEKIAEAKFKDGDKVNHASFGEGIVVERRGDLVTVAFTNKKIGIKKFAANIAPLEKI